MRALLLCLSLVILASCAAGETRRSTRTAAAAPVYSCVDTRIKKARHCRAMRGETHPSAVLPRAPASGGVRLD